MNQRRPVSQFQKSILEYIAANGRPPAREKYQRSFALLCMRGYIERGTRRPYALTSLGRDIVNGVCRG